MEGRVVVGIMLLFYIIECRIVKRLRSILDYGNIRDFLNEESRFVLTNATFFSTHNETGLNGLKVKETQKASIEYTKRLIDIIRPEHIICLGGKNCMNLLLDNTKPLLGDVVKLEYRVINGIPTYGFNHTSSCWSTEQIQLVGEALGRAFKLDNEPINCREFYDESRDILDSFMKKRNMKKSNVHDEIKLETSLRCEYVYACLCNYYKYNIGLEIYEKKDNLERFSIADQHGNPFLLITITNKPNKKKYIGVRYLHSNHPKDEIFDTILSALMEIDKSFNPLINSQ